MSISNIKEYIEAAPEKYQDLLISIDRFIVSLLPQEATSTISYQLPTYRLNGNLIHFALNKKHIGIYPGPDALAHFQDKISSFKNSKGAWQIPLDIEFPFDILKEMVLYTVEQNKSKNGPSWHKSRGNWAEAYEFMNKLILKTSLKKEFKWGSDIYTHKAKNVIGWGGFANFFSLWFYNGVFLKDEEKVLINANESKTKGLRQWRFNSVAEMNEDKILAYILESIETIDQGKKIEIAKPSAPEIEGFFKENIEKNIELKKAFEALSFSKQKEYSEYINEAKQEKTKVSRFEKIEPLILAGKGLNDKYKK